MEGWPVIRAPVRSHEELAPNPFAQINGYRANEANAYVPRRENARNLGVPSLNVMFGPKAHTAIEGYSGDDHVKTKMRLGDFLDRGGKVYSDVSAAAGDGDSTAALLVTLPEGQKVPVKIV